MDLTWDQVRAWRVSRQYLDRRVPKARLLDIVRDVCGIHAQLQSSAELQLWARVNGVTPEDVREALWTHRTLARTWAMRGTLHLLTASDLPLYVSALQQHHRWWKGAWLRMIGLSERELRTRSPLSRSSTSALHTERRSGTRRIASGDS